MFDYAVEETDAAELADLEIGSSSDRTPETVRSSLPGESLSPLNEDLPIREFSYEDETSPFSRPLEHVVSVNGLEAMICSFLGGIGEYSRGDIEDLFKLVDTDESGYIDKDEFDHFLDLATGEKHCDDATTRRANIALDRSLHKCASGSRRLSLDSQLSSVLSNKESIIGDASTIKYMEGLVSYKDRPLDDWSMFYCGASTPIEKNLRGIEKKYRMSLGIEKFDW